MQLGAVPQLEQMIGVIAAVVLGAAIGYERRVRGHPAGLHTNALVALGSAAFVITSLLIGDASGPARVARQVVTGVGFLCAGVIMHSNAARCAAICRRRARRFGRRQALISVTD